MDLLHPGAPGGFGVVLCPGRQGGVEAMGWLVKPLLDAGAAIAPVSYREGDRYLSEDTPRTEEGFDALRAQLGSQAPIFVAGHSRGATVALLAAAESPRWAGVAALSPTVDQERLVCGLRAFAPSRYRLMVDSRRATPEEDPEYYRRTSPLATADRIQSPVLLIHGNLDLVIPHDHSEWMAEALERGGNLDVELAVLPGVGHFFERQYSGYVFDEVTDRMTRWLARVADGKRPQET